MSTTKSTRKVRRSHTDRNILIAFILNLAFSIYEFIGGALTHSVAITSDAIHDIGDAISIGLSYILERKSRQGSNHQYTYGHIRYSLIGGLITTTILIAGSVLIIVSAISRIIAPVEINYNGMIVLAIIGAVVNFLAAYLTRSGDSLNQKSVNLHMLEDVLGWVVVLIGAIIMRFTDISLIDPILSILVALFILKESIKNAISILDVLLEKTPQGINLNELEQQLLGLKNVQSIHHLHVWSMDGYRNCATLHVVSNLSPQRFSQVKESVRQLLKSNHISHSTIEIETPGEHCSDTECVWPDSAPTHSHHHHH